MEWNEIITKAVEARTETGVGVGVIVVATNVKTTRKIVYVLVLLFLC